MPTEWQWHYLKRNFAPLVDAATYREKLPVRDQISTIEVDFFATREAELAKLDYDYNVIDMIEKIEVIADGSKVLYSMIPETAAFKHLETIGNIPNLKNKNYVDCVDHYRVKIPFGRWQRDEEYLLDTSGYKNVFLEVPWKLNPAKYVSKSFAYTMRYLRPMKALAPVGFIRSRDIEYGGHKWTPAGIHYVDLPLKYPWYTLGCRIYELGTDMGSIIEKIKLDIDDGRLVLVDDYLDDLITINTERLPYPLKTTWEKAWLSAASAGVSDFVRSYLGVNEEVSAIPYPHQTTISDIHLSALTGQRVELIPVTSAGTASVGTANVSIWGSCYMCCLVIKDWLAHPRVPQPMEPFPVAEHSEANLEYHHFAGVEVEDLRTFIQEVCPLSI